MHTTNRTGRSLLSRNSSTLTETSHCRAELQLHLPHNPQLPLDEETDQLARNNPPSPRQRESNSQLTHEDCLAILGLNWGATECEIRGAYYAKARELHPDRSLLPLDESTARFQVLNEAQDRLRGIDRDEPQDEEA